MDTKELLKKVRKIEIKTRRLSDHVFGGEYHSTFKGRGMTFSEVRKYQFGDDIRAIDWNVTARYNEPFVKIFEEERELTLMLMVDVSGSSKFGTKKTFKRNILTEIAATLAFSATQNNDKIGLILFSNTVELYIPPKKGRHHVLRIIRELLEFEPQQKQTNIKEAIEFLTGVMKKKAIVFMLSDFMDKDYQQALKIAAKRHDITGLRVFDPLEEQIPSVGMVQFYDEETNEVIWVNTSSKQTRNRYQIHYKSQVDYFEKAFKNSGSGKIQTRSDQNYVTQLLNYFKAR